MFFFVYVMCIGIQLNLCTLTLGIHKYGHIYVYAILYMLS